MHDKNRTEEYQEALMACLMASRLLAMHDLPSLLEAISRADTIGPIVDPTLWMKKSAAMLEDKEVFAAALPLYRLGQKVLVRASAGPAERA